MRKRSLKLSNSGGWMSKLLGLSGFGVGAAGAAILAHPIVAGAIAASLVAAWGLTNEFSQSLKADATKLKEDVLNWGNKDKWKKHPSTKKAIAIAKELETLCHEMANLNGSIATDFNMDSFNSFSSKVRLAEKHVESLKMLFDVIRKSDSYLADFIDYPFWSETFDMLENVEYQIEKASDSVDSIREVAQSQISSELRDINSIITESEKESDSRERGEPVKKVRVDRTEQIKDIQRFVSENYDANVYPSGKVTPSSDDPTWVYLDTLADKFSRKLGITNVSAKRILNEGNSAILKKLIDFLEKDWQLV